MNAEGSEQRKLRTENQKLKTGFTVNLDWNHEVTPA